MLFHDLPPQHWLQRIQGYSAADILRPIGDACGAPRNPVLRQYARAISAKLGTWAYHGFRGQKEAELIKSARCVIGLWLLQGRANLPLWYLYYNLGEYQALYHIHRHHDERHQLRVLLRAAKPGLQSVLLHREYDSPFWRHYILQLHASLWDETLQTADQSLLYCAFSTENHIWYLGKAKTSRIKNRTSWDGAVSRFREHWCAAYKGLGGQDHRPRYKSWKGCAIWSLVSFPLAHGDTQNILRFETLCIEILQPPTQRSSGAQCDQKPCHEKTARPFPRLREQLSKEREYELNILRGIKNNPKLRNRFDTKRVSFDVLLDWCKNKLGIPQKRVEELMYRRGYEPWLAIYLAQPSRRLHYWHMWRHAHLVEYVLAVWQWAEHMPKVPRSIARSKLERFLSSGNLLPTRTYTVRVPCDNPQVLRTIRHAFRMYLRQICHDQPYLLHFLCEKTRVCGTKTPSHIDSLTDQFSAAARFSLDLYQHIKREQQYKYRLDLNVFKSDMFWSIPLPFSSSFAWQQLEQAIGLHHRTYQFEGPRVRYEELRERFDVRCRTVRHVQTTPLESLCRQLRENLNECAWVGVDKDPHRRFGLPWFRYVAQLGDTFLADKIHYEHLPNYSAKMVAKLQRKRDILIVPKRWRNRQQAEPSHLPRAYLTIKGKCLSADGALTCTKPHAHVREIVSNIHATQRRFLHKCARAIRLAKRLSGDPSWTLWNPAELPKVLRGRVARLCHVPQFVHTCKSCGGSKPPVAFCKADASQFFKDASVPRGTACILDLLDRLIKKDQFFGVVVQRGKKAHGHLVRQGDPIKPRYDLITFDDIRAALSYAKLDNYFLVGDEVFRRKKGWAMGGALSEPATLADLGSCIMRLYKNDSFARSAGFAFPGLAAEDTIQGILYVDDSLSFSRVLCSSCIFKGLQYMFPKDVGFTCEASSLPLTFLQAYIHQPNQSIELRCDAFSGNEAFARGLEVCPKIAKFPLFTIASECLPQRFLDIRVWERLINYNAMGEGDPARTETACIDLLSELFLLEWPTHMVGKSVCRLPRRHQSRFLHTARALGRLLVRNDRELDEGRNSGELRAKEIQALLSSSFRSLLARASERLSNQ